MDPDPAVFVFDLHDINKIFCFFAKFFCLSLSEGKFISFFIDTYKVIKKSQNSRNQCFSYYFGWMIEGSGSVSLTNGSGSGRRKNIWILRIRICNTGSNQSPVAFFADSSLQCGLLCYNNELNISCDEERCLYIIWL